ncbi:acyloxyacyl hydrolase [uncultured Polaribacter sp.]|uniref:acyloxyacyl hydrolase n=1 Tax=uncultured Polaribacter sp. TaxID=174711 RepID=UPI0026276B35|nr:acyloxyacyl hydrolase [uncultured Polaribacter sp.]
MKHVFLVFIFSTLICTAQQPKKGILNFKKIGFLYNNVDEDSFLFNDKDYAYTADVYKFQVFYDLGKWKSFDFDLIVQPQLQNIKHQLINEQFVTPDEDNYEAKRAEFTALKSIALYGLEFSLLIEQKIFDKLNAQMTLGLGLASINKRSERLAKGFTFIENASLGLSYKAFNKAYIYVGGNIGHVSNLDTKQPNSGYTFAGYEIGFSYLLK